MVRGFDRDAILFEFDKKNLSFAKQIKYGKQLAEKKYSIWISAHQSWRSTIIAHMSAAPIRIGYNSGPFSRLVYTHAVDRSFQHLPEIERLLLLAKPLGIHEEDDWPRLTLHSQARRVADRIWADLPQDKPVLGIHPGSVWPTKRWPAEYYAEIAATAAKHNVQIMLFSGKGEENEARTVIEKSGLNASELLDMSGKLSLTELAACLSKLDCYLTNDSGPMHLAWAQNTPVTAIFGPTTKALGFFPRGSQSSVVETNLRCRPCGLHGHKKCPQKHHDCMRTITPQMVWQDVWPKLKQKS